MLPQLPGDAISSAPHPARPAATRPATTICTVFIAMFSASIRLDAREFVARLLRCGYGPGVMFLSHKCGSNRIINASTAPAAAPTPTSHAPADATAMEPSPSPPVPPQYCRRRGTTARCHSRAQLHDRPLPAASHHAPGLLTARAPAH